MLRMGACVALVAAVMTVLAPTTGRADTWFPVASMSQPRANQTATRLPNGNVLVAGGYNGFLEGVGGGTTPLTVAELFDPSRGSWALASPMRVARSGATATLLQDGRVLVIGGYEMPGCCVGTRTAEIYDPTTNVWTPVSAPPELQSVGTATLLRNGTVLITGLFGPQSYKAATSAAVYSPAANNWTIVPPMKVAREHGATATLLPNGNVLIVGGWMVEQLPELPVRNRYTVFNSTEEYDPSTNTWITVPSTRQARANHTATLLGDGTVLVTGGVGEIIIPGPLTLSDVLPSAEIYDPVSNSWREVAPMSLKRTQHSATLLANGRVLVAGGTECGPAACLGYGSGSGDCCAASSAEEYEPATDSWTLTAPVTTGIEHTATLLPEWGVLVAGGNLPLKPRELETAYIYASKYPPDEPPPGTGSVSPPAPSAPEITNVSQSHRAWREGKALAHIARTDRHPPIGTSFSFTLNEQASISFAFTQEVPGRELKGKCVTQRNKTRRRRYCTRTVARGTLLFTSRSGTNKVSFQGRISRSKKLPPGSYTLAITATDAVGQHSAARQLTFTIVK